MSSSTSTLDFISQTTTQNKPTSSIIWLHGLGADCHDFSGIIPELNLPNTLNIRFIFPNAPIRNITINAGFPCRAWYDIYNLSRLDKEDETSIKESQQSINLLIQQELDAGIPSNKIILAGFSQGGAMALYTGLQYPRPLAGILALSCYLPLQNQSTENISANQNTPILQMHGINDDVLPLMLGKLSYENIKSKGLPITFKNYPTGHNLCINQIQDIGQWLARRLM